MAITFDGTGHIVLAADWVPSDFANYETEVDITLYEHLGAIYAGPAGRTILRHLSGNLYVGWEKTGGLTDFAYANAARPILGERCILKIKPISSLAIEVNKDGVLAETLDLTGKEAAAAGVRSIGSRAGAVFLPAGTEMHSVKLTDLVTPANSSVYLFDQTSGTTLIDSGPLGNNGTLTGFVDPDAAWTGIAAPTATLSGNLQPGASFTVTYSNYDAIPVGPVTMTDTPPEGGTPNSITRPVTITNTVDGNGKHGGTATGTMPALPSSGSITGLRFGTVNVALSTG